MKRTNEVSKLVGVSKRTLQYYDDEGVLLVERSDNNHRLYDQRALERIWQVMIYKEMGFELRKIRHLLLASDKEQREYLRQRAEATERQIVTLNDQIEFISLILNYGMPQMPEESDGITYVSYIKELKKAKNMEKAKTML